MPSNKHIIVRENNGEIEVIRLIKSLTELNSSLLTGLETALLMMEKWDIMPDEKKEKIISNLRLLVENNRECFTEKPTMH